MKSSDVHGFRLSFSFSDFYFKVTSIIYDFLSFLFALRHLDMDNAIFFIWIQEGTAGRAGTPKNHCVSK